VARFGPFDWDAIDAIVESGYRLTADKLDAWEAAGRPTHGGAPEEIRP
jgi:hypothetical protein